VVYGGEFRNINSRPQQGLVRFAVKSVAPNAMGPRYNGSAFPITAEGVASGVVRVSWQANADPDNESLVYSILRNGVPVYSFPYRSQMWDRPWTGFTDTNLTPGGSYRYQVVVSDPFGNKASSPIVTTTAGTSGTLSAYAREVLSDAPAHYWRLGESGGSATDTAATNNASVGSGVARGREGAIAGDSNTAADLGTSGNGWIQSGQRQLSTNYFSIEAWIRPGSGDRGRIVGFGDSNSLTGTSSSSQRDRHLYLDNAGRIHFGINPAEIRVITSPGSYNDGRWHHVVGTMGADGLRLYVDGQQVASRASYTVAGNYFGYWRIGGDGLSGWPNRPSGDYYGGLVDEVAIYPRPMSAATVQEHYQLGGGSTAANKAPVASFTSAVSGRAVSVNGSGSSDPDGSIASHAWSFGDGGTATGATASHTYAAAGTYTVTLTVTDNRGATDTETKQVTVSGTGGALRAVDPARLADTRSTGRTVDGRVAGTGALGAGGVLVVPVTGRGGVPSSGVGAVVLNVTVTEAAGAGYVTAYPSGTPRPNASVLNYQRGQTIPNLVTVRPGADGTVSLHVTAGTHLVVDVQAWSPQSSGITAVNPARLADTRSTGRTVDGRVAGTGPVGSGSVLVVPVTGRGGVPSSGVGSVLLNVTVTEPTGAGYVTAYPSGTPRPNASVLNYQRGQTIPNLVMVRPGADGTVSLHVTAGTHVVVDVQGWTAQSSGITAVNPARLADTRSTGRTVDGRVAGTGPVGSGSVLVVPVTGRGGVPSSGVGSVVVNVTVTEPTGAGYVTAYPAGTPRPNASVLNYVAGQTIPNLVTLRPGADGAVALHVTAGTHVVVDVQGWSAG
jgi:PKD repeat protein